MPFQAFRGVTASWTAVFRILVGRSTLSAGSFERRSRVARLSRALADRGRILGVALNQFEESEESICSFPGGITSISGFFPGSFQPRPIL
jgi:hypothetical protein